ncbi:MAG: hypothetical protein ACKKL5_00400 [Candidatus Komeilibacteria bacterium]
MTERNVTDEQCLKIRRQTDDLVRRVEQGNLPYDQVRNYLQYLIEGKRLKVMKSFWIEKDGIIHFSVTSDGTTGPERIKRLEDKGFCISDFAKRLLNSSEFKPTNGITAEVAVLKGDLFSDGDRITKKIRAYAKKQKFTIPNAEIACLIREQFTDEDIKVMGLSWIIAMHEPIKDSDGDPSLLSTLREGDGHWLDAYWDEPDGRWNYNCGFGFAFVQSQVSST